MGYDTTNKKYQGLVMTLKGMNQWYKNADTNPTVIAIPIKGQG